MSSGSVTPFKEPAPPFAIISADKPTYSPNISREQFHALAVDLRDAGFNPIACDGVYKGVREASWLVPLQADMSVMRDLETLQTLARDYAQETILYVQWNGRAQLLASDPAHDVTIGTWREVGAGLKHGGDVCGIFGDHTEIRGRFYVAS